MPEGPDVLGHAEVCKLLGVSRQTLTAWRRQEGFPAATELTCGPVWARQAIVEWKEGKR
jgi:predicted DNA-binding transcriptional regulator AlpA